MVKTEKNYSGCLFLFFLIFAGVATFCTYLGLAHTYKSFAAKDWDKVPIELHSVRSGERYNDDSVTHYIEGSYSYSHNGQRYTGNQFFVDDSGGLGIAYDDKAKELQQAKRNKEPIYAYVNPDDPNQSLIFTYPAWDYILFIFLFSSAFGIVGFGGIIFVRKANQALKEEKELKHQFPTEPWKWKQDWLDGKITSSIKSKFIFMCALAILVNAISSPILFVLPKEIAKGNYAILIGLLFNFIGLTLIIMSIKSFIQWRKYHSSHLNLSTLPISLGASSNITWYANTAIPNVEKLHFTLSCIQNVETSDGYSDVILWSEKQIINPEPGFSFEAHGVSLNLSIPYSCKNTSTEERIRWVLEVDAQRPGVDFHAKFEVPVFYSLNSDKNFTVSSINSNLHNFSNGQQVRNAIAQIDLPDSKRFTVPRTLSRKPYYSLGMLSFAIIWNIGSIGLFFSDAPLIFPISSCFFGILILWGTTERVFEKKVITSDANQILIKTSGLIFSNTIAIPRSEIDKIKIIKNITQQSATTSGSPNYKIVIATKHKIGKTKEHIAANYLEDKTEAEQLTSKLNNP